MLLVGVIGSGVCLVKTADKLQNDLTKLFSFSLDALSLTL